LQERLGIAGSGAIACGLAATAAQRGDVLLWARSDASADRARGHLEKICGKLAEVDPARVEVVTDLGELGRATFLVEAVVEDHGEKAALLSELASHAATDAVLATTTSSLSIAELAKATGRPESFIGLHVYPHEASVETRARARELCEALGKTPVEVPDIPGFVVNRLLFPYLFNAVVLLAETGMSAEDVDRCMTLGAGMPMGPLALLDFVGLDVAQAIGETIGAPVPAKVVELVAQGALGRKSGRGFFTY
jgi:3-hydroxybutyryl-CoA dehydrogenase